MSIVTGAEVLADRERLLKSLPRGEGLHGIVTTDRAESVLYVLSRYEDDVWWLSKSKETGNSVDNKRKLDFTRISGEQLRTEAKVVMVRLIWAENALANATIRQHFHNLALWLNWLHDQGIRSHTQVSPLVAFRYVQYVRRLTSPTKPGTPLGGQAKFYKLSAVERCWQHLRDTASGFDHPWPDSTATALAGWKQGDKKAKTEIIPDDVLKTLFQHAESLLRQANDLLAHRDAVAAYQPRSKYPSDQSKEKIRFLKTRGWDLGSAALNKTLSDLRNGCFVIILATTGIRAHELGLIHRGEWFSEVRDGERFYFLVSRSDKTHAGKTSWLCPKIAIDALKVLERLSAPMQRDLESALEAAKEAGDLKEITRLQSISGAVGLTKDKKQENRLCRLSNTSLNTALNNVAKTFGLDCKLVSHQFRRTFANYVVHHKLGDLRYLRDHFKHWSLDMTVLYAMNEAQDLELYDEIYAASDGKRQAIVGHWLERDTPLSGGMAGHIRHMRSRTEEVRTYKDRRAMVEAISELVFLRSTGIAWCTNDTGVDCCIFRPIVTTHSV